MNDNACFYNLHSRRPTVRNADRFAYYWGKDLSGSLDGAAGVGGMLYVKRNGVIYVPFYDAFGNVMGYWDEQGNVVAEYAYDAFGRTVAKNGTMANMFSVRYSTKYFDAETGMYYYGRRFYLLALRRWLTRDPIEEQGGVNLYAFCGNDGVSSLDVIGLKRWVLFYCSRADQVEFRKAAETMKREIESRGSFVPACDKVISKGVLTVDDFSTQWAPASVETVEVRDGKLNLGVCVERTDSLESPKWYPVGKESLSTKDDGTFEIVLPAGLASGFYRLISKDAGM